MWLDKFEDPSEFGLAGPSSWTEWGGYFLPVDSREAEAPGQTAVSRQDW